MQKYTCLEPVKHDGKRFVPGDVLSLSEKDAAPLVEALAVVAEPEPDRKAEAKAKA